MNLSSFSVWFLGFTVLCGGIQGSFAQLNNNEKNYISWDDMKVDDYRLHTRDEGNWSKVIVVDQNGRGNSLTVQGAVDMVPEHNADRVKIYILPGVYSEKVYIPASKPYISFIGDQNRVFETVITWHNKASDRDKNGAVLGTFNSATATIESDYFVATWITFENTVRAVPGGVDGYQAVALRIAGDKAMFYNVRFLGSQDTLLDQTGSHYFYQCFIQGSTDFIFGNAKSLYQECTLHVVENGYAIAAQHRNSPADDTGFSFLNCTVKGKGRIFLGRAWGDYSRVIYSYCEFDGIVRPEGWNDWRKQYRDNTVVFGEYECRGYGADRRRRVPWAKALNYMEAKPFLGTQFIGGEQWLRL
ncbi:Pectinesterase QRT1 [Forsythia ovata]|uniref:Pectinesterase n=1 Tax=Forsythia ovata TaxID=205694 RepID=A0ABD1S6D2_9LAMI